MTDREKIADWIEDILDFLDWDSAEELNAKMTGLANHLISNGVVVREKGEWEVGGHCNHKPCRIRHADKWTIYRCSRCGYSNGRKKSANFCPNCGADMRKGENDG